MNRVIVTSASIVVGQSTSNPIVLNSYTPSNLSTSASVVTGTTITFLVSHDGTNYMPLYDDTSTEVSLTAAASARAWGLKPGAFFGWSYLKVRLGTSASAKLQATYNLPMTITLEPW
jgi:hypothetical protein